MRPIDADALMDKTVHMAKECFGVGQCYCLRTQFQKMIEDTTTIDAVPVVHSAWKHEIEDMGIFRHHTVRCLNCNAGFTHAYVVLLCGDTGDLFKHCPNCGATMDGKESRC